MTQATETFAAIETASDGSTAGNIVIPPGGSRIKSITASVAVNGAQVTNTGPIFVLRLSGTGALPDGNQDLVLSSLHLNDGGGSLTYTSHVIVPIFFLPVDIKVNDGASMSLLGAYYGTDAGSPQICVGIEFE